MIKRKFQPLLNHPPKHKTDSTKGIFWQMEGLGNSL